MFAFCLTEGRAVGHGALAAPGRPCRLCAGHEGYTYEHQLPIIQQFHAAHRYVLILRWLKGCMLGVCYCAGTSS